MTDALTRVGSGIVVRLRGLPTKATKEDVADFLGQECGATPRAVHLSFTARRSTAEAYVVFDTLEQAQAACTKDKDIFGPKFGDRYVRVSVCEDATPEELHRVEGTAAKPRRPHQRVDTVVKVDGLPAGIPAHLVLQLFWGWQIRLEHTLVRDTAPPPASPGRGCSGVSSSGAAHEPRAEAFIDFELADHAAAAVATRHGTAITTAAGIFQLSVQFASKAEWDTAVAAAAAYVAGPDGPLRLTARIPPNAALLSGNGTSSSSGGTGQPASLAQLPASAMQLPGSSSMTLGMPPLAGLGPMSLLPQAAAAASAFMTPFYKPGMPAGTAPSLPRFALPPGFPPPGVLGAWPAAPVPPTVAHLQSAFALPVPQLPGMPGMDSGAAGWFGAPWPGMPPAPANPYGARYMVQDLTTGQQVFLDPGFNLSGYGALPPGLPTCSAAPTAGTFGATAGGPAPSQQTAPFTEQHWQQQQEQQEEAAAAAAGAAAPDEMSGDSNGLKSRRQEGDAGKDGGGGDAGQSSNPTPSGGGSGNNLNGGGSSGNGYSVAVAKGDAAGGADAGAAAVETPEQEEGGDEQAEGQLHPNKRRHRQQQHHNHPPHHRHYPMRRQGAAGSSGDEARNNGESGGGSNEGSGNGSGDCAEAGGRGQQAQQQGSNKAAGDNSSGDEGCLDAAGGSSGEGSGADDGATGRTPNLHGHSPGNLAVVQAEAAGPPPAKRARNQ